MAFDHDLVSLQEMRNAVQQAKEAQEIFSTFTQEQVDAVVQAIADAAYAQSLHLAKLAVEETGLGVVAHKEIKNQVGSKDVYESIKDVRTVGILQEDQRQKVIEVAVPYGVVAGIVPVTNPTSTAIFKTLIAVKARNAIVFSPHPSAKNCTITAAEICAEAAEKAGAPKGLIGWISSPTMEATQQLMKHRDVNVILATGGSGLVRAAYSSGKPAFGVGPGNVPAYIEKTANVKAAVGHIVDSKTFDYGTICASEQSIIVDKNIKEMAVRELKNRGAYFLNDEEKKKMETTISPLPGKLNPKIVGKSPLVIAKMAGISVPSETTLLIAFETEVGKHVPFSIEKLAPVFAFYTASDSVEALDLSNQLLALGGRGHSLALHTSDDEIVKTFALKMPVSRLLVNTPSALGAVGATTNLKPSFTLGCGTYGGNVTSDNVTVTHLFMKKRVAYGTRDIVVEKAVETTVNDEQQETQLATDDSIQAIVAQVLAKASPEMANDPVAIKKLVSATLAKQSH
ncbi:acetaldehyde dehydrogenase [Fictibacillus macauensis ZFHKF-1]|uniref:Acetaldehyde dehydrogenase n=1 Tax=Fictibacillus macauensis ZFHKF-1 TaxID=1196324 RepID=I8UIV5_9BACL|nr:acetaldehyde dehydrogenase (acetylating) [Fictibacillus macauensis]EIT86763.1 acetaldehyde dehydrogenase [Fictibacillus macauensis ZFHKF-1]